MRTLRKDERGITSVVVAVCLVALIGAAMLTIDAGNVWSTRREIITGTDAAALDAAQLFNSGFKTPCDSVQVDEAEQHATNVAQQNQSGAIHNPTDTPD